MVGCGFGLVLGWWVLGYGGCGVLVCWFVWCVSVVLWLGDLSDLWMGCVFMDLFRVDCLVWVLYVLLLVCLFVCG